MNHWLLKTEPSTYSWEDLLRDKSTAWTGVRNFGARNFLRAAAKGDLAFLYYSGDDKAIVAVVRVTKAAYPDPTAKEGDWSCLDVVPVKKLKRPVTLAEIKKVPALKKMVLVNNSRLSVQPVTKEEWEACLKLSGTAA